MNVRIYVRHCKENTPIYMYYVAPETPMMSSVIADCPDLAPPNILDKSTPMHETRLFKRQQLYTDIQLYLWCVGGALVKSIDAFRPEGRGFETRSSRHVGYVVTPMIPLGKSYRLAHRRVNSETLSKLLL